LSRYVPEIAAALAGVPSRPDLNIWFVRDDVQNVFNSVWGSRATASTVVGQLNGAGGQDNVPALLEAWEWAATYPGGAILWIHAGQPLLLNNLEALKQRIDWRGADGPSIIDVEVQPGPNRITEQLAVSGAMTALPRLAGLRDDLDRLFGSWSGRHPELKLVRAIDEIESAPPFGDTSGSSHIVRLWAFEEINRLIKIRRFSDAVRLAGIYQLVTPVSGAVVLETQQQFAQAGLTPADPLSVPAVPEPGTWALIILGMALFAFFRFRRRSSSVATSPRACD
jgi:hypothetical protein